MSKKDNPLYWLFGGLDKKPLTAAGQMFDSFDRAEKKLVKKGVSDEVLAALRRVQVTSAKETT